MSEKTEKPTPKRLRDAREKGQVAKSKEIATCAAIVGLFAYLWFFFDSYLERLKNFILGPAEYYQQPFGQALISSFKTGVQEFALLTIPIVLAAFTLIVLSYLIQVGFLVSFEPVKPDFKKVNPVEGVKRIFSMSNLLELVKSILKIVLLGSIVYLLIKYNVKNLLHSIQGTPQTALEILAAILKKLVLSVSALFIIIAIIDHFFQKYLHIRKLRMSKDDIKREYKDREGDPYLKQRRRQLQIEMATDNLAEKIKQSTVVFTQSKKLAVVIYYEMGKTSLPVVSVKSKNIMAEKVIAMAKTFGIPIFPDAALAGELYENCRQDSYISSEFIEPVALVLRQIMGLEGQKSA